VKLHMVIDNRECNSSWCDELVPQLNIMYRLYVRVITLYISRDEFDEIFYNVIVQKMSYERCGELMDFLMDPKVQTYAYDVGIPHSVDKDIPIEMYFQHYIRIHRNINPDDELLCEITRETTESVL